MKPIAVILMGVSGAGKTTVGLRLAERLGCSFYDGDDLHPPANIEKMSRGIPLTDADREPWLDRVSAIIEKKLKAGESVVIGCSALREKYRQRLLPAGERERSQVVFAYLKLTPKVASERLNARRGHFMPPSLLNSQFETLEEPVDALVLDGSADVETIVEAVLTELRARHRPSESAFMRP